MPYEQARVARTTGTHDYLSAYVDDLENVVDMEAIRKAGVKIGADPMGGASVDILGPQSRRNATELI